MRIIELGTRTTSRIEFRAAPAPPATVGVLGDPAVVTVTLRRPDGSPTTYAYPADAQVVKDSTGVYHVDFDVNQAGQWWVRWVGSGSGPNVAHEEAFHASAAFDQVPLYGASRAGVLGYLPSRTITETSKPSLSDIDGWLADVGQLVAVEVGWRIDALANLTANADAARRAIEAQNAAGAVVELGAAAWATDASFPERASLAGTDTSYGGVLWERHRLGLESLVRALDGFLARFSAPEATTPGPRPSFRFPTATITDGLRL